VGQSEDILHTYAETRHGYHVRYEEFGRYDSTLLEASHLTVYDRPSCSVGARCMRYWLLIWRYRQPCKCIIGAHMTLSFHPIRYASCSYMRRDFRKQTTRSFDGLAYFAMFNKIHHHTFRIGCLTCLVPSVINNLRCSKLLGLLNKTPQCIFMEITAYRWNHHLCLQKVRSSMIYYFNSPSWSDQYTLGVIGLANAEVCMLRLTGNNLQ
jgi:hypothetical protein